NISAKKDERRCQGIKHCEFSDSIYLNIVHNNFDIDSDFYYKITIN
ncbi:2023_t:CDS:1, partial [Scutellospora calospora]